MTETLLLKDLCDNDWQKYFDMMQEVRRKYYPGTYNPDYTPMEMKNEWFTYYDAYKGKSFEQYAIFNDKVPEGWVGFILDDRSGSFNIEANYDEIPGEILKVMLSKVYEFMDKNRLNDIYHWTFVDRKITALKGINAPVYEEMINTIVYRNEMNPDFYNGIISGTDITGFRLMFCEDLPEELYDNFTLLMYDILDDYWSLNPVKQVRKRMEKEDWLLRDRSEKLSGATMQMYKLLTPANEIAAYCSLYVDRNNMETIRHSGGFTAVARTHRGKGLAKYLKAKMYLKLLEENNVFTNIETDTMPWNTYMYRINKEFGFKPFKYGCEFKLTKEFIKNYLTL
jgi:RimJ/RimL family protein N-acetyltransferase